MIQFMWLLLNEGVASFLEMVDAFYGKKFKAIQCMTIYYVCVCDCVLLCIMYAI